MYRDCNFLRYSLNEHTYNINSSLCYSYRKNDIMGIFILNFQPIYSTLIHLMGTRISTISAEYQSVI